MIWPKPRWTLRPVVEAGPRQSIVRCGVTPELPVDRSLSNCHLLLLLLVEHPPVFTFPYSHFLPAQSPFQLANILILLGYSSSLKSQPNILLQACKGVLLVWHISFYFYFKTINYSFYILSISTAKLPINPEAPQRKGLLHGLDLRAVVMVMDRHIF